MALLCPKTNPKHNTGTSASAFAMTDLFIAFPPDEKVNGYF